jgi:hypothetical protein
MSAFVSRSTLASSLKFDPRLRNPPTLVHRIKDYVWLCAVPITCKQRDAKPSGKIGVLAMEAARLHGILRATLCEIEHGVFYVTYFQDKTAPDTENLPHYQVGKSASEAKQQIEASARAIGYAAVSWKEAIVVPVFAAQAETARGKRIAA